MLKNYKDLKIWEKSYQLCLGLNLKMMSVNLGY